MPPQPVFNTTSDLPLQVVTDETRDSSELMEVVRALTQQHGQTDAKSEFDPHQSIACPMTDGNAGVTANRYDCCEVAATWLQRKKETDEMGIQL